MKELLYKKGLLLKVVSWENDADNYLPKEVSIDNLEEGKALKHLFENLFKSENDREQPGIGNANEGDYKTERVEEYRLSHSYFKEKYTEEEFLEFIRDEIDDYMGWSEWYAYRVCESATLYEIKEDVYLEKIEL